MCVGEPAIATNDQFASLNPDDTSRASMGCSLRDLGWAPYALKRSRAAMVSGDWSASVAAIERHGESKFAVVMPVTY